MRQDRITIGLYSLETSTGFDQSILDEIKNVSKIQSKFIEASRNSNKEAPQIIISALLIPNWGNSSNYKKPNIAQKKGNSSMRFKEKLIMQNWIL